MRDRQRRERPRPWPDERQAASSAWMISFRRINWWLAWVSWALSHWALLDVLDHLGTFSVLIAVVFYFADSGNRVKQKHYQAWQVINTAQGKGGSGGRIEALQELNADHVSLTGVDAGGAFLRGIQLEHAHLERCDLHAADLRSGDLKFARLPDSNLQGANFRQADLSGADLRSAELQDSDLNQANLDNADLAGTDLSRADLRLANVNNFAWKDIQSMQLANVYGIRNASAEFLAFAQKHGAVSLESDEDWNVLLRKAASGTK
ncbi:pentapeptide repeat-containing protein [Acidicapsa acidisoli]|uniref:pentapeptide repeat-containing protein n=1 Tax=Acidicapsa acidisoli TaxID=1615681 RepID=UPI0021E0573A|nr:pentapeptide repeat-containing protein [Acidicapsa acidisoli]